MQFKQLAIVAPLFLAFALASPVGDIKRSHDVEARDKDSDEVWLWKEKKREELEKDSDAVWLWKKEEEERDGRKRDQLEKDSDDVWLW
ncbi:hypothetical protein F5X96DRAFT_645333 [Biscogniauxia mediterranea]|nr:hypothetical protein F5X96DRAFT_645333 [Biscogniauxia mediterranea]